MAVSAIVSNHAKYQLGVGALNLKTNTIKVLLMRSGFVFSKKTHATLLNIHGAKTAVTLGINSSKELTDSGEGLIAAGFVPGNQVTISGFTEAGNNCTKIIATVAAGVITFTDTTGLVEEGAGDSVTVTADDELATGNGYTQDTEELSGQDFTEDNDNDLAEMVCDDFFWTPVGDDIGPTPGAILYSDTSADKTIIGYADFGSEKAASPGELFGINNLKIQLP